MSKKLKNMKTTGPRRKKFIRRKAKKPLFEWGGGMIRVDYQNRLHVRYPPKVHLRRFFFADVVLSTSEADAFLRTLLRELGYDGADVKKRHKVRLPKVRLIGFRGRSGIKYQIIASQRDHTSFFFRSETLTRRRILRLARGLAPVLGWELTE